MRGVKQRSVRQHGLRLRAGQRRTVAPSLASMAVR